MTHPIQLTTHSGTTLRIERGHNNVQVEVQFSARKVVIFLSPGEADTLASVLETFAREVRAG
jgi:hypothetical protein